MGARRFERLTRDVRSRGSQPIRQRRRFPLGDAEAAEQAYRAGIAAGDPWCHHNLAVMLEARGELDEVLDHYRLAADAGDQLAAQALHRLDPG
jgi:hypothetical protein